MPREINLQEYRSSEPYPLSVGERDSLKEALPSVTIEPVEGTESHYTLTAGSIVGALEIGDLSILIQPKIDIPKLLSLACYAIGAYRPDDDSLFDYKEQVTLPDALADALALALGKAARRAFSRGLLHGYRKREEALQTVRGRIRFADQIRRRYGIAPPVEVRYEEFTDDIRENQLVKAAARRLGSLRLRSPDARRGLGWIAGTLDNVSTREFAPRDVPEVTFGRLNDHYAGVIALSRLILRHGAFESGRGDVRATGFLMDMNVVFQEFVTTALGEALRGEPGRLLTDDYFKQHRVALDTRGLIGLEPDLAWRQNGQFVWVGDAKYKNLEGKSTPNADLYQLLAYITALNLPSGTLIYAKGEADTRNYTVKHAGKRLNVVALDISCPLNDVLGEIQEIAEQIKTAKQSV